MIVSYASDADLVAARLVTAFRKTWFVDDVEIEIDGWGQPGELLAAADDLMYEVKRRGGGDWLIPPFP